MKRLINLLQRHTESSRRAPNGKPYKRYGSKQGEPPIRGSEPVQEPEPPTAAWPEWLVSAIQR